MRVVVICGSRNPSGQTAQAGHALLDGVREAGGDGTQIYLPELKISRCAQCEDDGWGICRSEGRCTIGDDLSAVADEIRGADAVVFSTPVYFGDLSESLRAFLDRLRRTCIHEDARPGISGKRAIGICVAGGGGGGAPSCVVSMERTLQSTGFDIVDLIPARRQNLATKIEVLRATGRRLAGG